MLPDFLPAVAEMVAAAARWQDVLQRVAALRVESVDAQEAELMGAIMGAISAADRDAEEVRGSRRRQAAARAAELQPGPGVSCWGSGAAAGARASWGAPRPRAPPRR